MKKFGWILISILICCHLATAQHPDVPSAHEVPGNEMNIPQTQPQTRPSTGISDEKAKALVVAKVNDEPISLFTVRELFNRISHMAPPDAAVAQRDAMIQTALDRAIFEEMVYHRGINNGMAPPAADIDSRIQALKEKLGAEAFAAELTKQKQTEQEWRDAYVRRLVIDHVLVKELAGVQVTDQDLAEEYEKSKNTFYRKEKVEVTDIVFLLKQDDPASAEIAQKMLSGLQQGEKSPEQLTPDGTFIVRDLELTAGHDPELYAEAKKLQVGQYSNVIHARDALHIIRLKEFIAEKQFTLEDAKPLLKGKVEQDAKKKRIQQLEAELKKQNKIKLTDRKKWIDKL